MASFLEKLKQKIIVPTAVQGTAYTLSSLTSAACLYLYFTQIAHQNFWHWQLIPYLFMLANAVTGFSELIDDESLYPLRDLLDYSQLVLTLPCYAAQMWIKNDMGPPELALVHVGLGIGAVIMYVLFECRRQDLTDLAVFANGISLLVTAGFSVNVFTFAATIIFLVGYCMYKRNEVRCFFETVDRFNFFMAAFAVLCLISYDDQIVDYVNDAVKTIMQPLGISNPEKK